MCDNWKIIFKDICFLIRSNIVSLAAIDSCKPGIVLFGEEHRLIWCDVYPSYLLYYRDQPWRLDILKENVVRDLKEYLNYYDYIVYYVNVKAYREALDYAKAVIGSNRLIHGGPSKLNPLSYRSKRERENLLNIILSLSSIVKR